jgi:lysozyme
MVANFEGFKPTPYRDSTGKWTIGHGIRYYADGRKVRADDPAITKNESMKHVKLIIDRDKQFVESVVKVPLQEHQLEALTSLVYNIGQSAFYKSELLKKLNQGDLKGAAIEFEDFIYAGARRLTHLELRRKQEKELFRGNI